MDQTGQRGDRVECHILEVEDTGVKKTPLVIFFSRISITVERRGLDIQYGNLPLSPDIINQRSPTNVLAFVN